MTGLETAIPGNLALFGKLTAVADSPALLIVLAKGLAEFGPLLALAVAGLIFFHGGKPGRHASILAGVSMLVGLCINFAIALVLYAPRPFETGLGLNLLHHAPETSFPSDHATLIWSLGFGLLLSGRWYRSGAFVCGIGIATAWSRVYLGAHFPLDMAGSLFVSLVAACLVRLVRPWLSRTLLPLTDRCYAVCLSAFGSIGLGRRPH